MGTSSTSDQNPSIDPSSAQTSVLAVGVGKLPPHVPGKRQARRPCGIDCIAVTDAMRTFLATIEAHTLPVPEGRLIDAIYADLAINEAYVEMSGVVLSAYVENLGLHAKRVDDNPDEVGVKLFKAKVGQGGLDPAIGSAMNQWNTATLWPADRHNEVNAGQPGAVLGRYRQGDVIAESDIERMRAALRAMELHVRSEAIEQAEPRARPAGVTESQRPSTETARASDSNLTLEFTPGKRPVLTIRFSNQGRPAECKLRGKTRATLARLVLEAPDVDHAWKNLLTTGLHQGLWKIASPDTLRRQGLRIRAQLPPALKGYWEQDARGVRWRSS